MDSANHAQDLISIGSFMQRRIQEAVASNGRRVIALEMLKDIEVGEELIWDYGEDCEYGED